MSAIHIGQFIDAIEDALRTSVLDDSAFAVELGL